MKEEVQQLAVRRTAEGELTSIDSDILTVSRTAGAVILLMRREFDHII